METYAASSSICCSVSLPLNEGMTPWPFVTRSTTSVGRRLRLVEVRADRTRPCRRLRAYGSCRIPPRRRAKTSFPATTSGIAARLRVAGVRLGLRRLLLAGASPTASVSTSWVSVTQ